MMRLALKFAYNGTQFSGYARQPNLKTVESELIQHLISQGFIDDPKTACFRSASRTDKGVSALGNVVAFNTESSTEQIFHTITKMEKSIIVYGIKEVDPEFYPRYATWRIYRYYLKKNTLQLSDVVRASDVFIGEHDFRNFARVEQGKTPIRKIENIIITKQDEFFIIDFYAQTFLWHQIRRIIAAIEKVGIGKLEQTQIIEALEKPLKKIDFGLAPAKPLLLKDIIYGFAFEYKKNTVKNLEKLEKYIVSSLRKNEE